MIELVSAVPALKLFRRFGFPRMLPINLTIGLTNRCNSRCKTCRVYDRPVPELGLAELSAVFRSLGRRPYWMTFSGGEPFLREDIVEICESAYLSCRPAIMNIASNGLLSDVIPERVARIAERAPGAAVIVNLSLDEIGERHDEIRGVRGNFARTLKTFERLKAIDLPNLTVGIHTVISKFNVGRFPEVCDDLTALGPDSYIAEIAEERQELGTLGLDITPSEADYAAAVDHLVRRTGEMPFDGMAGIARAFRTIYYQLAARVLREKRQAVPCFAGYASAQIAPDGEVWACCVKAESMGNLRDAGYDFGKIWFSDRAEALRKPIRDGECYCPLANAGYTNMLLSTPTLAAVLTRLAVKRLKKPFPRTPRRKKQDADKP